MRVGFSWLLGAAFWEELALLRRTQAEPGELAEVRRNRLVTQLPRGAARTGDGPMGEARAWVPARKGWLQGGIAWQRLTSGSSGAPAEVPVDRATYARMLAGFWRAMDWWGVQPGERGLALLGTSGRWLRRELVRAKDRALGVHRVVVDDRGWVREARRLLARRQFAYVYGYPSALYELARAGVVSCAAPRVVVTTGEPLFAFQREVIQSAFGAPVAEEFGCTELGTVAFQCPEGSLHATAEQVWLEPAQGRTLATSLLPRPVPVVRYPLDEPVTEVPGVCGCGLALPRVALDLRQSGPWRGLEELARRAAACLPARFTVRFRGGDVTVQVPVDAAAGEVECLAAALGPEARVERVHHLPRRAAGKFRYLEGDGR